MGAILFPFGVRLITWLTAAVFVGLAVKRRDSRPLLAGLAWITGFEAAFQATHFILGLPFPVGKDGPILYIVVGCVAVAWTMRVGVRPWWPLVGVTAVLWAIWMATGFHFNGHGMTGFSISAELVNETAKTLWALAYLVPLLARERRKAPGAVRARAQAGVGGSARAGTP